MIVKNLVDLCKLALFSLVSSNYAHITKNSASHACTKQLTFNCCTISSTLSFAVHAFLAVWQSFIYVIIPTGLSFGKKTTPLKLGAVHTLILPVTENEGCTVHIYFKCCVHHVIQNGQKMSLFDAKIHFRKFYFVLILVKRANYNLQYHFQFGN